MPRHWGNVNDEVSTSLSTHLFLGGFNFALNRAGLCISFGHTFELIMKHLMKTGFAPALVCATILNVLCVALPVFGDDAKVPLALTLPDPTMKGTPEDLPKSADIEPIPDKPVPFMVPNGVKNVALGKKVTSSDAPYDGDLTQITDGKKLRAQGGRC